MILKNKIKDKRILAAVPPQIPQRPSTESLMKPPGGREERENGARTLRILLFIYTNAAGNSPDASDKRYFK